MHVDMPRMPFCASEESHRAPRTFTVNEILRTEEDNLRVRADDLLETLLGRQALMRLGALMAVDADGRLQGVVTWDQVRRALQQPSGQVASR